MAQRNVKKTKTEIAGVRIIGGKFRRQKLLYSGDPRTRPMKDRLREAVFNLLGEAVKGTHAIDLFAGTGALGLEALSRGAVRATFCEQHFPTVEIIHQNIAALGVKDQTTVVLGNVFLQFNRLPDLGQNPWTVFCSPPYDLYICHAKEMSELILKLLDAAPLRSLFVVEADSRFDFATLPKHAAWDIRSYPPAVVGVYSKE